jgi:Dolichyl-phosphate-mannose-protein mannosyltransferase
VILAGRTGSPERPDLARHGCERNTNGYLNLMMDDSFPKPQAARAWFLAGLVVVFLRALPNLRYPIGRDQATYCVIGQGLLHGQLLYRDLWDNKPPGIFFIYALIVKVFGPVMWCVGAVDILWLLVISCCIFYFARRYMGTPAAALAMVFNAVRHCRQGYIHAAQPETFLMLCVFAAYFLLLPGKARSVSRLLAAGLILGAGVWLKYNAVAFFPFVGLVPFLDVRDLDQGRGHVRLAIPWRDWLTRMLMVGTGFVFAILGVLAYFRVSGAWPALMEVQFEVLPRYGAMVFHWNLDYFLWAIRQSQNHLGFWTEIMAALALLIGWRCREMAVVAPALLLGFVGYIAAAMQGRFHPYYFETCYPFFSMFWGYVCVKTYEGFKYLRQLFARKRWALARALLWVVLAALGISLFPEESVRVAQHYRFLEDWWRNPEMSYIVYWWQLPLEKLSEQLRVINYLKENSSPNDEVYVWGTAPLINFLSQRENPSRFVSNLALISTWGPPRWRQELVHTLETKRPRYIVVARHDSIPSVSYTLMDSEEYIQVYPALRDLLNRQYQVAVNFWEFEIYQRK